VVIELPNSGWTGLFLRIGFGSVAYALSAITVNLMDSRERAVRFAKRAARRWTASRDTAALK
jgi:hypothetical protein